MKLSHPLGVIGGALAKLRDDRSGISIIYAAIALPVIIGFALLAIDVSRLWSLQSSLQHAADSIALAAAGELDRTPTAISRSQAAIDNMVSNPTNFADGVAVINGASVTSCFLSDLPASDATPIDKSDCLDPTDSDSSLVARFVRITVNPVDFRTLIPASFLGGSNIAKASAQAVAGFDAAVCNFTPMFLCNPYESVDASGNPTDPDTVTQSPELFDAIADPAERKRLIEMRNVSGNSSTPFPGDFGFLEPPDNPGANAIIKMIGAVSPPTCFNANGVNLEPGGIISARFGFNVRFDMYQGPMNKLSNDPNYRPSMNVRKGYESGPSACANPTPSVDGSAMAMPKDDCFLNSPPTCTNANGRIGNGNWDKQAYWDTNFSNSYGATLPTALSGANVSRYDFYRYMIDQQLNGGPLYLDHQSPPMASETGTPQCYKTASDITDTPDRRIFYAAILNCQHLNADSTYGPITGSSSKAPLPVVAFAKLFLTRPVSCTGSNCNTQNSDSSGSTKDNSVWAEIVDVVKPGDGGTNSIVRDQVQLYR